MPIMKIRGGDLDLVEYEFEEFAREKISRRWVLKRRSISLNPCPGTVHVRARTRIHLTVLDMKPVCA